MNGFWKHLDSLVESCRLVIDRPRGSRHPRFADAIYPVDYGYLQGTRAGDGEGIDVWRGSLEINGVDTVICTFDPDKRDAELKLLVGCSSEETQVILTFLNTGSMSAILVKRGNESG